MRSNSHFASQHSSGPNVRFVPKADILRCGKERRYSITCEAERLGGYEVDDEIKSVRLQHWLFGGLGALEDAAGVGADLTKHVCEIGSVAHQPAD
jgi:hypothetical protein